MKTLTKLRALFLGASIILVGWLQPAIAQQDDGNWHHRLAPLYLWGMGIDGTAGFGPVNAPLNIEFKDALDNLEGIFTVHYEASKANWTILTDFSYVNLGPSAQLPNGQSLNVDFKNPLFELGGAYRFDNSAWEVLGGVRYFGMDIAINAPSGMNLAKVEEDFYDLFVGGRVTAKLSQKWTFIGRADVGAGDSDFVGNAGLFFDWRFGKVASLLLGYRWLTYDIETGSGPSRFKFDATLQGPVAAVAFTW
jgi:hypothetical protein